MAAAFFAIPLVWLLLAPTKSDAQLFDLSPLAFGSFSRVVDAWSNVYSFNNGIILTWALNSAYYALATLGLSVAVTLPAGYAIAVGHIPGRRIILWLTLITMILPSSALVLPLFLEMNAFNLVDTPWSVILPGMFFPFGVYLSYIYYDVSLPKDLVSAARMDGCDEVRLFWYIGLPLAKPLLGILTFLSFTRSWNDYFLPYVMLNNTDLFNLPVGLQTLISSSSALRTTGASAIPIHRAEAALMGVLMLVPVAVVFLFSQKWLTRGILSGATKE